jgi:hypothetical protein
VLGRNIAAQCIRKTCPLLNSRAVSRYLLWLFAIVESGA